MAEARIDEPSPMDQKGKENLFKLWEFKRN
jgi:hypothetical protein